MNPLAPRAPVLPADIAGVLAGPVIHDIDARWLMAYAAGLGVDDARYYDTTAPPGLLVHPLFAVCYEWPAALAIRARTIPDDVAPLGVHLTHHLTVHRSPRPGDRLATSVRVEAVQSRRAGTLVLLRFETTDAEGRPVTTTLHGSLYRGVEVAGHPEPAAHHDGERVRDAASPGDVRRHEGDVRWRETVAIPREAAHVYTECARIWNPIHTDLAVARAAGLPGLILHGTATLALAVSRVIARDADGQPRRVSEIAVRFTGMVPMPSDVVVRGRQRSATRITFDALDAHGRAVLGEGVVCLSPR
jgi:acyl dehydratase